MSLYTLGGLCAAAQVSSRQADHWVRTGYLRPVTIEGRSGSGTGNHRLFDDAEVHVATILGRLADPKKRAALVREVVEHGSADLGPADMRLYIEPDEGVQP